MADQSVSQFAELWLIRVINPIALDFVTII